MAKLRSWVTMTMVVPASCTMLSAAITSPLIAEFNAPVGSSAKSTAGCAISPRQMAAEDFRDGIDCHLVDTQLPHQLRGTCHHCRPISRFRLEPGQQNIVADV